MISNGTFPLFNPGSPFLHPQPPKTPGKKKDRKNHTLVSIEMRRSKPPPPTPHPSFSLFLLIPKAWLKTISLFWSCTDLMRVWHTLEKGNNLLLKVLLAVIKPNEKMRCKESQFRVPLNYKGLGELLGMTSFKHHLPFWKAIMIVPSGQPVLLSTHFYLSPTL